MKSGESNKKKRSLLSGGETVNNGKRTKYGDGAAWFRGAIIGEGSYGRVFIANLKNAKSKYTLYPPIMAVKSACISGSGSIQKEKEVMDNICGSRYVIKCFGEEITNGDEGQMMYNLLLEYGSGGTLADLIKNSNNGEGLPELDVRRHARSIVRGLSHVHKLGFVHCDLKPQNVLLVANYGKSGGFVAKIGDFGLTKRTKQKRRYNWRGTPMYLSPEAVINGVQEQPADIWAVGCIVYEMLTGKPLWFSSRDLDIDEILTRIHDENELFSVSSSVSEEGKSFLQKCLCRKVMCRLTANMLLNHPFLKGLGDEVEESCEVFDINSITSSPLFDDNDDDDEEVDDDELWLSSVADLAI